MAIFDADTLRELRDVKELRIRTEKHPKTAVVIWIVVADDEVFVRSWLGPGGRWGGGSAGRGGAGLRPVGAARAPRPAGGAPGERRSGGGAGGGGRGVGR